MASGKLNYLDVVAREKSGPHTSDGFLKDSKAKRVKLKETGQSWSGRGTALFLPKQGSWIGLGGTEKGLARASLARETAAGQRVGKLG